MSPSDKELTVLKQQIRDQQELLAEVLPALTAYLEHMKSKIDRGAIHQVNPQQLEELINRVANSAGK